MCNFLLLHISHVELHVNVPIRGIYILPNFPKMDRVSVGTGSSSERREKHKKAWQQS